MFWKEAYISELEEELSPLEKELRELFVREYLFDRDPTLAAVRCGFRFESARKYGADFLREVYVQNKIKDVILSDDITPDIDKKIVLNTLREGTVVPIEMSRVSAASKLASILGMDAPTKSEVTHRGGVMAIPTIAGMDDWEKAAMASQDALLNDTREDPS